MRTCPLVIQASSQNELVYAMSECCYIHESIQYFIQYIINSCCILSFFAKTLLQYMYSKHIAVYRGNFSTLKTTGALTFSHVPPKKRNSSEKIKLARAADLFLKDAFKIYSWRKIAFRMKRCIG